MCLGLCTGMNGRMDWPSCNTALFIVLFHLLSFNPLQMGKNTEDDFPV